MKISLAQMEVVPGRPKKNLETMLNLIEQAKQQHVDLIAFPELCVSGYLLGDKWTEESYCQNLMEFNQTLQEASNGIAIAYGNICVDNNIQERTKDHNPHPNKDGRSRKYNAVYVFQDGKTVKRTQETPYLPSGVQPKTLLPNYRMFDDERYFFSLEDVAKDHNITLEQLAQPFLINTTEGPVPIGFEICEDLWCEDYRQSGQAQNITKHLIDNGAKAIINISASPWTTGKNPSRDKRIQFLKDDCEQHNTPFVPFFYVNCVGTQNNGKNIVTFDGGSTIYDAKGQPIALSTKHYNQELLTINTTAIPDMQPTPRTEESDIAQKYQAIIAGIQHMKHITARTQQPRYVIGLSGGIDSAIVAALLVQAVGKEKVLAINMPSEYNSAKTKQAAAQVAEKLDIQLIEIPITTLTKTNIDLLETYHLGKNNGHISEFGEENLQAKLRGTAILSNIAAENNALFTNNGNKLEVALGYATLYGDVGGALAPIADLTKVEVFAMAKYLNEHIYHQEIIPQTLIPDELCRFRSDQIKPSAELKHDQIDPMKFGYHDALLKAYTDYKKKSPEDIMQWYINGTLELNLQLPKGMIHRWGLDDPKTFVDDLEWFTTKIQQNVFKRVQSPPIIILSKSSYGYDIRESMLPWEPTLAYDRLKEKITTTMTTYHSQNPSQNQPQTHSQNQQPPEVPA